MPHGEEEADGDRALAVLHQLARHVVDGRDVIGVDGVPQAQAVDDQRNAQQGRLVVERGEGPEPGADVEDGEKRIDGDEPPFQVGAALVEEAFNGSEHGWICL